MGPLTRKKLKPGQNGTKKIFSIYGDRLLCVRYRYDAIRQVRLKTIELIVDSIPWIPADENVPDNTLVDLKIGHTENYSTRKQKLPEDDGTDSKDVGRSPSVKLRSSDSGIESTLKPSQSG